MAHDYEGFGSCILLNLVAEDDLGRLARAGTVEDGAIDRAVWLRILDGGGLRTRAIIDSFDTARKIGELLTGAQIPSRPFFVEVGGVPAIGFDYLAGQPLNRVLTRARDEAFPLQPDNSLLIVEKIALALTAGESIESSGNPLVHGFLHPGLVHLSNDGEAVVAGYGLGEALLASLDRPEAVAGARAYLAPEVLDGGPPSQHGDVYSLGAILFHLLTGTALPLSPADRTAALDTAHLAWDGEPIPADIRSILATALSTVAADRFESASAFRSELDRLLYGGAYSPTTFNLALFMDRLFRAEMEADELAVETERDIDPTVYLAPEITEPEPSPGMPAPETPTPGPVAEATPPEGRRTNTGLLWAAVAVVAVIGIAAAFFWFGPGFGPQGPPPVPTPTAEEIAAQRQAQEDRLRILTQEMVKEMMVEREEEIRQELIARQTRIEELQKRLQQSERRARKSTVDAAKEEETQRALKKEIEAQEEAQQAQQDALENERKEALEEASAEASRIAAAGTAAGGAAATAADADPPTEQETVVEKAAVPTAAPSPTPLPPKPTRAPTRAVVRPGQFVAPAEADTLPVVIKSQSLEWPRSAARSKGKGVVVVQLTVSADGGVDDVEVLRADHTGWGIPEAAVEAAAGYRFKPGTKDGVAVSTHAFVTWRYDFTGGE